MTYSDATARNHKLTYVKMRAGQHSFLSMMRINYESICEGLAPAVFPGDTEAVGAAVEGSFYYLRSNGNYDLALDLGPTDRSNRFGLVYCRGGTGVGSAFDGMFYTQGMVLLPSLHGNTTGIHGYLSSTTPGLLVPNEGATSGFSDADDPAKPIILGIYQESRRFMVHIPLVYV